MATNRKRTKRTPKSAIPKVITKQYRKKLTIKDFTGKLEDHEIPIAKKAGILRWDLWKKAGRVIVLTGDLHRRGYLLAPVFNEKGEICNHEYPEKTKFLIKDYADLAAYKAEK